MGISHSSGGGQVLIAEFESAVHDFLAGQPGAGQSSVIILDAKICRGAILAGHSHKD